MAAKVVRVKNVPILLMLILLLLLKVYFSRI